MYIYWDQVYEKINTSKESESSQRRNVVFGVQTQLQ